PDGQFGPSPGTPYFDFSGAAGGVELAVGATTPGSRTLGFRVPNKAKFTHQLALLGSDNRSPVYERVPRTEGAQGRTSEYPMLAIDPDGQAVHYELVSGPQNMHVVGDDLVWDTAAVPAATVGRQAVVVKAADNYGGSAFQSFEVSVLPPAADRPPLFR